MCSKATPKQLRIFGPIQDHSLNKDMMMDIFGIMFANMQMVFLALKSPHLHLSTFTKE